jgi:hypothetical protein
LDRCKFQREKTRAIFAWIAGNIEYDVINMFALNFSEDTTAKIARALQTRKGICENYATLFTAVCNAAGIESVVVEGYTKQRGFTDYIPHAWSAARLDGAWYLFDPTWGSGYIEKGQFTRKMNDGYFKATPESFIATHMPFDYLWVQARAPGCRDQANVGHRRQPAAIGQIDRRYDPANAGGYPNPETFTTIAVFDNGARHSHKGTAGLARQIFKQGEIRTEVDVL